MHVISNKKSELRYAKFAFSRSAAIKACLDAEQTATTHSTSVASVLRRFVI